MEKMDEKYIEERKKVLKYGKDKALKIKNLENFLEAMLILMAFPFIFILSNLFYGLFEVLFLILRLCFKSVKRGNMFRDRQGRLYRRYQFFNCHFNMLKPFIVVSVFCPRYFQIQSSIIW